MFIQICNTTRGWRKTAPCWHSPSSPGAVLFLESVRRCWFGACLYNAWNKQKPSCTYRLFKGSQPSLWSALFWRSKIAAFHPVAGVAKLSLKLVLVLDSVFRIWIVLRSLTGWDEKGGHIQNWQIEDNVAVPHQCSRFQMHAHCLLCRDAEWGIQFIHNLNAALQRKQKQGRKSTESENLSFTIDSNLQNDAVLYGYWEGKLKFPLLWKWILKITFWRTETI